MEINIKRKILENSLKDNIISLDEYLNELENLTNREYTQIPNLINFNSNQLTF